MIDFYLAWKTLSGMRREELSAATLEEARKEARARASKIGQIDADAHDFMVVTRKVTHNDYDEKKERVINQ